ncbi:MAG: cupin domain-containing protein [Erythrobacter sp.]|uniref:cupin domain-containing protein n=1 Tax=Erythrobacter sp. TaxID=1042 RepID=UPI003267193A
MRKDPNAPWWAVIGPDEGQHRWQPLPSRGYVSLKLSPENMPYDGFSSGIQVLPAGCNVREHGHKQNHELIFVYEGTGTCEIEDEHFDIVPGCTILFGRYARHLVTNTGDCDMRFFWVFFPPGLENWFEAIGKVRQPGEEMPEAFDRPEGVEEVMEMMRFVPPRERPDD